MYSEEPGAGSAFSGMGDELRDRSACVRDHDLFAAPHSLDQVREHVSSVVRVVLRQQCWLSWLGQAAVAGLAEP